MLWRTMQTTGSTQSAIDRTHTHTVRMADLVRVGSPYDGGYVIPEGALRRCDAVLGLGVHADWSFEQDALSRSGARVAHLYDATTTRAWLWSRWPRGLVRVACGVLSLSGKRLADGCSRLTAPFRYGRFFRGGVRHVPMMIGKSASPGVTSMAEAIMALRAEGARNILLKMDIEGGEYEVLEGISEWGEGIAILVVEFHQIEHDVPRFNRLLADIGLRFVPVHLHGNNTVPITPDGFPGMVEISFLDRGLARELLGSELVTGPFSFPIAGLDSRSTLRHREISFTA